MFCPGDVDRHFKTTWQVVGRVACCSDNAARESLFTLLQKDVFDRCFWTTVSNYASQFWIERTTSAAGRPDSNG